MVKNCSRFPLFKVLFFIGILFFFACSNEAEKQETSASETTSTEDSSKEKQSNERVILFFGNSLTAGYGLEEDE
ncbi:MAG: hypothetical protein R2784_21260, partial [Saprospiraceae bacterium]